VATKRLSRGFKDISLSFVPHPVTKDISVLTNERAIVRAVRNLVETIPTERFFQPFIGSDIRASLFENFDIDTADEIKDQIIETVTIYEPRVDNLDVVINAQPDRNSLEVTVFFDIVGLDVPTQAFTFLLEPTR
tara:strand:- start:388 stop:789 length:402 start_codon:yes stop_codon:yes gene_type:complete